ncbi:MAG TPA: hypothetical protein VFB20_10215 [Burkholderiales bacterium]|nr:hypothetical protein [Burkholderiales bacterium]
MNLPILKLLGAAVMLTWERRYVLLRALWLPLSLGIALSLAGNRWGPQSPEEPGAVLWALPLFVLVVMLAVRSYRVFLLGDAAVRDALPISWSLRETRFMLAMLSVSFGFALAAFLTGALLAVVWPGAREVAQGPVAGLIILPAAYVTSRLLPVFPLLSVAEGRSVMQGLRLAWGASRDNGFRILVLCVLIPGAAGWLIAALDALPLPGMDVLSTVLVWLLLPAELSILALVYDTLTRSTTRRA